MAADNVRQTMKSAIKSEMRRASSLHMLARSPSRRSQKVRRCDRATDIQTIRRSRLFPRCSCRVSESEDLLHVMLKVGLVDLQA